MVSKRVIKYTSVFYNIFTFIFTLPVFYLFVTDLSLANQAQYLLITKASVKWLMDQTRDMLDIKSVSDTNYISQNNK